MSKVFVQERDGEGDDDDLPASLAVPAGTKNYMTPEGYQRLKDELLRLIDVERPEVVAVVSWAASNGDRSENGDYIYGKKRLREIDRRIRFLTKRLEIAEIVDPSQQTQRDRVFFGASVEYVGPDERMHEVTIVGLDEVDPAKGRISWVSPVARALNKASVGDVVMVQTPGGKMALEVLAVRYPEAM